tara:strand:+ start:102 stop:1052 length:951 start_codon:yes stop_codon:yes gene_type:complete
MKVVRTVDQKTNALGERQEEQRKLGRLIDRLIADGNLSQDDVASVGAGRGICPTIGRSIARFLGLSQRVAPVVVSTREVQIAPVAVSKDGTSRPCGSEISRAVLGLAPSRVKTPQIKLAAASEAMRARVESLELRVAECRSAATAAMKVGNKASAMRELKRAKMLEKQSISTQIAVDALEAQSDMLEQTALQKEVAAALGATAKSLKREKGLLSKAEGAVDAAMEMKDMHEDLTQAMSGLGDVASNDLDEDELMEELQNMAAEHDAQPVTSDVSVFEEVELVEKAEKTALKKKNQFPAVPKTTPVERQGLLAGSEQ